MKLDFVLIADHAYADALGKFFILGEFRYIFARAVPVAQPRMALAMRLVANRAEVRDTPSRLQLEMIDGDGNPVLPRTSEIPVQWSDIGPASPAELQALVVVEMQAVPLPRFGDYSFHVFVNGSHLGAAPFSVQLVPQPAAS
jgi:hypothetical protein